MDKIEEKENKYLPLTSPFKTTGGTMTFEEWEAINKKQLEYNLKIFNGEKIK